VAVRYFCDRCGGEVGEFGALKIAKVLVGDSYVAVRPMLGDPHARQQAELCGGCREAFLEVVRAFVAGVPAAEQAEQAGRAVKVQTTKEK
jgi:hypothetical protein